MAITYPPEMLPRGGTDCGDVIVCANHPNCPLTDKRIAELEAWANRLAYGIAKIFGQEIGTDPDCNPWDEAMSILESACVTHARRE